MIDEAVETAKVQPEKKLRVAVTLAPELVRRLDVVRSQLGITRSSAIALALHEWLRMVGSDSEITE